MREGQGSSLVLDYLIPCSSCFLSIFTFSFPPKHTSAFLWHQQSWYIPWIRGIGSQLIIKVCTLVTTVCPCFEQYQCIFTHGINKAKFPLHGEIYLWFCISLLGFLFVFIFFFFTSVFFFKIFQFKVLHIKISSHLLLTTLNPCTCRLHPFFQFFLRMHGEKAGLCGHS